MQISKNCPECFASFFIPGVQGGPPPKLCTRAFKNLATPLDDGIDEISDSERCRIRRDDGIGEMLDSAR